MSAEPYPAVITGRLSVPEVRKIPYGYFRSKLFVTSSTSNPLVAAASPLLSLLERLSLSHSLPTLSDMRENIEHELRAFHSRLLSLEYANELIAIADYLLSATIDELLGKNYLRLYNKPAEFQAFTSPSHGESEPQHRFFEIINILKQMTSQYLDILELAYYCIITGFEGEHHVRADGRQQLDNLIEELYQLIYTHRVNKPPRLFNEHIEPLIQVTPRKPMMIAILLGMVVLISFYTGCQTLLEHKAARLLDTHMSQINRE